MIIELTKNMIGSIFVDGQLCIENTFGPFPEGWDIYLQVIVLIVKVRPTPPALRPGGKCLFPPILRKKGGL